ncbi:YciI family protein [Microtetraspora fusca]|uniref:YciI family protein n=1 Tax=Microtetraspora fusca TaxID=1997 RepID=A0ABW6V4S1_MICFU|nr:YciI family protein [Microtetraspora fusca]
MVQYLLNVYQPDAELPAPELARVMERVTAWDKEVKNAGAWVFTGGLHHASTATVVRAKDGDALLTDGPFVEGKEHIGGFTVIRATDLDAAVEWARKLSEAAGLPIEVRPMQTVD